jgi:hypothetical protein
MRTRDQWSQELARYKDYFSTAEIPVGEVETGFGRISSLRVYVDANLDVAEKNLGNTWFEPSLDRLKWAKEYIESR